ncbi:hypothetical protein MGU_09825 [Metarhizium guizhouense ARSEF 977]|uniref:Uncharacterized protein n=1 Tax=Metarhizium guizhouense (strain ARSEF 977) TaxID=1276136 RepID=A0A0B4GZF1_METGA|nr:hypothetical protein MGU_09825 [Metarhizium guizhouense ARSEF 977]
MDQLERKNRELLARVMMAQGVLDSNQITDTDIQSGFLQLRDAIFSYIQAIYRHLSDEQPGWSFKDALLDRLSRNPSAGKRHWMKWLAEHNNNTCIFKFHDNYQMWLPLGMSDSTHLIFEEIMNSIEAGADKELANRWRSTTLVALVGTDIAQRSRSEQTGRALEELSKSLLRYLGLEECPHLLSGFLPNLEECVVKSAADLYQRMACSRHQYSLETPNITRGKPLYKEELAQWDLKSTTNWLDINSEDDVQGLLCCLFPGVRRLQPGEGGDLSVVKPLVLVYDTPSSETASYTTADSNDGELELDDLNAETCSDSQGCESEEEASDSTTAPGTIRIQHKLDYQRIASRFRVDEAPHEPSLPADGVAPRARHTAPSKSQGTSRTRKTKARKRDEGALSRFGDYLWKSVKKAPSSPPAQRRNYSQRNSCSPSSSDDSYHGRAKEVQKSHSSSRKQHRQGQQRGGTSPVHNREGAARAQVEHRVPPQRRSSEPWSNSMVPSSSTSSSAYGTGTVVWSPRGYGV